MGEARRKKLAQAAGVSTPAETLAERVRTSLARYEIRRTAFTVSTGGERRIPLYRCGTFLFVRTENVAPQEVSPTDYVRLWTRPDGTPITLHEAQAQARAARRGGAP